MFDIAWSEMVVIGAVALIAIGPKDLPKALRAVGAMTAKARRMASEFQDHFREAMREAELESVKQEVANISQDLSAATSGLQGEVNSIGAHMPSASGPSIQPAPEAQKADTPLPSAEPASSDAEKPGAGATDAAAKSDAGNTHGNTHMARSDVAEPVGTGHSATLSVEASPTAVIVTETATPPASSEKPARKKRAAGKPKAKSDLAAQASLEIEGGSPAEANPKARKRPGKTLPSGDDRAA